MARTIILDRIFYLRNALDKEHKYSEFETFVLIGIQLMNKKSLRCSGNTLADFLSKAHRTPGKKELLATLKKFKAEELIRINGVNGTKNIKLNEWGRQYLMDIEDRLKRI